MVENTNIDFIKSRIGVKKESLDKMLNSFNIYHNINYKSKDYEDNAINKLLEIKQLKAEIEELEFLLSIIQLNYSVVNED